MAKLLRMRGKGRIAQYMRTDIKKGSLNRFNNERHRVFEMAKFRRILEGMFM